MKWKRSRYINCLSLSLSTKIRERVTPSSHLMALVRCNTKRAICLTATVFVILAIMSSNASSCQASEEKPQPQMPRRRSPPPRAPGPPPPPPVGVMGLAHLF
ncbi:hypothetical protein PVAP13_8NG140301 [Panicum virgatum]|uniref:Uncharacterized protein n=1 Tax=Panicum virgatum TaxID=38727 RepID=A0A8T0PD89_PANVG|nr:hypothetical protein PVAP13_8NG140301 [Panicum virgatum]